MSIHDNKINGKRFNLDPWTVGEGDDAFLQAAMFLPDELKAKAVAAVRFALGHEMECTLSTFKEFCDRMDAEFEESMIYDEQNRHFAQHYDPHAEQMADVPW